MKFTYRKLIYLLYIIPLWMSSCSCSNNNEVNPTDTGNDDSNLISRSENDAVSFEAINIPKNFNFKTTNNTVLNFISNNVDSKVLFKIYAINSENEHQVLGSFLSNSKGAGFFNLTYPTNITELYVSQNHNGVIRYKVVKLNSSSIQVDFTANDPVEGSSNGRIKSGCVDFIYGINRGGSVFKTNLSSSATSSNYQINTEGSFASAVNKNEGLFYYENNGEISSFNIGDFLFTESDESGDSPLPPPNITNNRYERMAFNLNNNKIYAGKKDSIFIINKDDFVIENSIKVHGLHNDDTTLGGDLAINTKGDYYLSTEYGLYSLIINEVYSLANATLLTTFNNGFVLSGIDFDSNGNLIGVTDELPAKVLTINTVNGSMTNQFTLPKSVDDIAIVHCDIYAVDNDNDGVIDLYDDYPFDSNLAFDNFFPSEGRVGSVAFEDLYPNRGDYDFNDVIVVYQFKLISNANNLITRMEMEFVVKVVKSQIPSAFAIELPITKSQVLNCSGYIFHENDIIPLLSSGIESGNTNSKAIIPVFDNSLLVTLEDGNIRRSNTITVVVDFTAPIAMSTLGEPPFNPFIIIGGDRSREVHLPGKSYTAKFNQNYLQEGEDAGNFKTAEGHPWALHIPTDFVPPRENVELQVAYKKFENYAESGGLEYQGWYTPTSGYRDDSKLEY